MKVSMVLKKNDIPDNTATASTTSLPTTAPISVNTFTSPNYPHNFPPDVDECWVQTPTDGHAVTLTFSDFDVRTLILFNFLLLTINVFLALK